MQPRIPRQSAGEQDDRRPDGADLDDRFDAELAAAVSGARRRAVRDGDRQIDTAHLLHSLLESDAEVRAVLGDGARIARLLGYLVQRSIGYGLRWQSAVEDSGAVPVVTGATGFSPLAAAATEEARARAVRRGAARACGVDLLAALVADPQARAVEVLARAAVEPDAVLARVEQHFEPAP
ncbi:Clp protease N-terminal domain-containing protein [Streptomyces sp. NPDC057245]|uniref:Clp protease N-terminal domain-containing protein n=1 Tax=Streptomyces TaxID=1883 RepID=UPI001C1DED17|nr:Clp protease N-terminal domain-containing protein [Streptomyces sp. A108]MBU6529955.1 peptidase [Streptomyces sp. A108]